MANMTDFLRNSVVSHFEEATRLSIFTTHVALVRTAPSHSAAGSEVSHGTGAYSRETVFHDAATSPFWEPSGTTMRNDADITWATATADWGPIVGIDIYSEQTGGDRLFFGSASTKTVENGDTYKIPASNLTIGFH